MSVAPDTLADRFDFGAAVRLLRRHALVLASCAAIGLAAGYGYDSMQTPIYTATAKIEANPASARVLSSLKLEEAGMTTLRITATTRERLRSRGLAERVVADLDLAHDTTFLRSGRLVERQRSRTIADLIAREDSGATKRAVDLVRGGLSVDFVRNTGLLKVTYAHPDAQVAARVANQVAQSYIAMERERLTGTAGATRGVIEAQLAEAEAQLEASEAKVAAFVSEAGLAIGIDGEPFQTESIGALRKAHAQATTERVAAERRLRQLERDGAATLPASFANGSLQNARNMLARLRAEYRMKRARMKPDFPAMLSLADRIRDFEGDVDRELAVVARATRAEARQARDGEAILAAEVAAAEERAARSRQAGIGYSALRRQVEADRSRYATLAGKLADVTVSAGLVVPPVTLVDEATVPTSPSNGSLLINLLLGLLAFGSLGAAFAAWREVTRDGFELASEITDATGVPVMGTVPKVRFGRIAVHETDAGSRLRESYRYLRNKLRAGALQGEGQVLLVAGIGRRTGASTTARRLALDLAALDRRVLLIDADLAQAVQADAFGIDGERGLTDLLEWRAGTDVAGCFTAVAGSSLTLLPAGRGGPETGDRLASDRMEKVLRLLRKSFDAIVIDAAPVLARADAAALSTYADATLLVVRHDRTRRSETVAAMKHLRETQANVIGAVFTRYEKRAFERSAAPDLRSGFKVLRELVQNSDRAAAPNAVHEMVREASKAMTGRRAA